ncbi:ATP-binding protein [Streptomyces triticagri]|uniref:ATP-binding protein n=1 Tax=Streptomyces triticagri TaxID=2293568 RepID=A0A372MAS1_9ACTN|nr:ATP-binding protein [Streptomyces triticagri]RFU87493.1 ATP-binding protein [Streptomyces triticagri]
MPVPAPVLRDSATYPPHLASVPLARRRIDRAVRGWGLPELAYDAALLGSELASNALLHGCLRDRLFRVEVERTADGVRVSVTDPKGERWPQPRTAEASEQFGRGLAIVQAVATRWGVLARAVGKTVWAELDAGAP